VRERAHARSAPFNGTVMSQVRGSHRAARLVELGAKRPDRAAALCQEVLVLEDALDAGAKPILGLSGIIVIHDVSLAARRRRKGRCDWVQTSQACGTVALGPTALTTLTRSWSLL
jgi:hypothetical protein